MQIVIGSEMRITDAPKALFDWCSENLVLPNPEYANRSRRGLWLVIHRNIYGYTGWKAMS